MNTFLLYNKNEDNFSIIINGNEYSEEETVTAFAKSLKEIREYSGFSLKQISNATNIPIATISAYENGKRIPSFIIAIKLAAFWGLRIEDLIYNGLNEEIEDYPDMFTIYDEYTKHV